MECWHPTGLEEIIPLIAGERQSGAWETGDVNSSPLPVGQSIGLTQDIVSCEELLSRMMREAGEILARVQKRFAGDLATQCRAHFPQLSASTEASRASQTCLQKG